MPPPAPTLSISGANGSAAVGDTLSFTPTISGGTAPYTVTATGLPPGRAINNAATGLTTGAYTTAGTYSAIYTVRDSGSPQQTAIFSRTVTVTAAASAGDPTRFMFAATRLRFPIVTGTVSGTGTVYMVQSFFFGSPDYAVTEPRFFLPTFYQVATGANPSEFAAPAPYQFEKLSIKVGGIWYECPTAPFLVDPAVDPVGFLLAAIPGVTIPLNSFVEGRMAFSAQGGVTLGGSTRANDLGEISMSSTAGSLAAKCTDGSALTQNGFSRHVIPAFMVAKGWDGRPVGLLAGDSIQAGANENSIPGFMSPRGVQGYWQRGLDDNTQSKRIAFGTLALEGARPSDWQNRTAWSRKLDAVAKATAANGGKPPFTFIGSNHGNNSATVPNPYTWLTGFWQVCKTEWPGVPIYHSEMLARASSSDGYQSLAGQTVAAADAYNGGTNPGIRWTANELIGKGALTGDPSAQARVDGWIAGSFAPWRAGSFDTGANRDKQAVIAFDTTLAADSAANNTTLTLASTSGLALGDMLIVNPGGTGSYDAIVRTISGNVVTLSGASGTAMTTGTRVTASLNDRTGLHPSTRHHQKIAMEVVVPWKQAIGMGL
ncbi:hypothetical protein [Methylorubrum extorquens]